MLKEQLREFAERARQPVADAKADYWKAAHAADPLASMAAAHAAFEHARAVAGFPPRHYLDADLAHHIALKQLIDRASAALLVR
ncbi:MAG TPA: hypothetical protein VK745_22660 [Polyangiaceae bacterium]|jgi:hypothetical protein|nr:hypothetical protein [Polyangiaceae bacterium]